MPIQILLDTTAEVVDEEEEDEEEDAMARPSLESRFGGDLLIALIFSSESRKGGVTETGVAKRQARYWIGKRQIEEGNRQTASLRARYPITTK